MHLLTDVPDVGTGRGMRYYACSKCDHIQMRPIDWKREHVLSNELDEAPEDVAASRARRPPK